MEYIFRIGPYDTQRLLPQVSQALEARTELLSRARYPGLWSATDKLRGFSRGKTRSKTRSKIMGILYLALGIFLFVPGLMAPKELTGPLLIGGFGILAGIFSLWSGRKRRKNPFDESARLLLTGKDTLTEEQGISATFTGTEMKLSSEDGGFESVPYDTFEFVIESSDLLLFTFDTRVAVLQKSDLSVGKMDEFCNFISGKVPQYRSIVSN